MTLIPKASYGFKQDDPATKVAFGQGIIDAVNTDAASPKPLFPNLPVKITELQNVNDALAQANANAKSGSVADVAIQENAVKTWDLNMFLTANYVNAVAALSDSPTMVITAAKFVPTKDFTTPHPLPSVSSTLTVYNNGKKGAIIAENQKKIDFAKGYVYTVLPDGATMEYDGDTMKLTMGGLTCYIIADTRRKVEIFNLPKTPWNVSVCAFNSAGTGPMCPPVTITPGTISNG